MTKGIKRNQRDFFPPQTSSDPVTQDKTKLTES